MASILLTMSSKHTKAVDERLAAPTAREAIRQTKPFRSLGQEALISLMLTTEAVRWPLAAELAERADLTLQQYNVLRILKGAGRRGLPTLDIGDRMIERAPGVTRMLDRLERKGLVARERSTEDRRQVRCRLTTEGSAIVRSLAKPIDALDERVMGDLSKTELREFVRMLNKVRTSLR